MRSILASCAIALHAGVLPVVAQERSDAIPGEHLTFEALRGR